MPPFSAFPKNTVSFFKLGIIYGNKVFESHLFLA